MQIDASLSRIPGDYASESKRGIRVPYSETNVGSVCLLYQSSGDTLPQAESRSKNSFVCFFFSFFQLLKLLLITYGIYLTLFHN